MLFDEQFADIDKIDLVMNNFEHTHDCELYAVFAPAKAEHLVDDTWSIIRQSTSGG